MPPVCWVASKTAGRPAGAERTGFSMMESKTFRRHLASLLFLVCSVLLLVALLGARPVRRVRPLDPTRTAAALGWYEETEAGSGQWVYRSA